MMVTIRKCTMEDVPQVAELSEMWAKKRLLSLIQHRTLTRLLSV